jgi:aspartate 1-decarboxylase
MLRNVLKSKIHRAYVTDADVDYEGSITLDPDLMDAALLVEYEKVHVWSITSGARLETYVIEGERGSGAVAINGAAAHLINEGDTIIIASYAAYDEDELEEHCACKVFVDEGNRIKNVERCKYVATCLSAGRDRQGQRETRGR